MNAISLFEGVRKELARQRKNATWSQVELDRSYVCFNSDGFSVENYGSFEVVHPNIIASRLHVAESELRQARDEERPIKKNKLVVEVAISRNFAKQFIGEDFAVYCRLSRRDSARCDISVDKLLPMPEYPPRSSFDGPGPSSRDLIEDFREKFREVIPTFDGLEPALKSTFRNLVDLMSRDPKFGHDLFDSSTRRYHSKAEEGFIFPKGPLDNVY